MIKRFKKIIFILIIINLYACGATYQVLQERRDKNYEEGVKYYKQKKYKEANESFKTVVSIDPQHKRAQHYLKRTEDILKQAEKEASQKVAKFYSKGIKYKKGKKYDDALSMFLNIEEIDPNYKDVQDQIKFCRVKLVKKYKEDIKKAQKLYKRKHYSEAYSFCLKARRYDPEGSDVTRLMSDIQEIFDKETDKHRKKAENYYSKNDYEGAKEELQKLLKINPWDKEANKILKNCNRKIALNKEYLAAAKEFKKRNYFEALARFHNINRREKGYKDTDWYLAEIGKVLSSHVPEYYNKGVQYYEKEKYEEAIDEWNKVLIIDPNHEKAREYQKRAQAKLEIKESLTE
jgi:tetratricopeptide (TPR) repeat protein